MLGLDDGSVRRWSPDHGLIRVQDWNGGSAEVSLAQCAPGWVVASSAKSVWLIDEHGRLLGPVLQDASDVASLWRPPHLSLLATGSDGLLRVVRMHGDGVATEALDAPGAPRGVRRAAVVGTRLIVQSDDGSIHVYLDGDDFAGGARLSLTREQLGGGSVLGPVGWAHLALWNSAKGAVQVVDLRRGGVGISHSVGEGRPVAADPGVSIRVEGMRDFFDSRHGDLNEEDFIDLDGLVHYGAGEPALRSAALRVEHDPAARIEIAGALVRILQMGGKPVDAPLREFSDLLRRRGLPHVWALDSLGGGAEDDERGCGPWLDLVEVQDSRPRPLDARNVSQYAAAELFFDPPRAAGFQVAVRGQVWSDHWVRDLPADGWQALWEALVEALPWRPALPTAVRAWRLGAGRPDILGPEHSLSGMSFGLPGGADAAQSLMVLMSPGTGFLAVFVVASLPFPSPRQYRSLRERIAWARRMGDVVARASPGEDRWREVTDQFLRALKRAFDEAKVP